MLCVPLVLLRGVVVFRDQIITIFLFFFFFFYCGVFIFWYVYCTFSLFKVHQSHEHLHAPSRYVQCPYCAPPLAYLKARWGRFTGSQWTFLNVSPTWTNWWTLLDEHGASVTSLLNVNNLDSTTALLFCFWQESQLVALAELWSCQSQTRTPASGGEQLWTSFKVSSNGTAHPSLPIILVLTLDKRRELPQETYFRLHTAVDSMQ